MRALVCLLIASAVFAQAPRIHGSFNAGAGWTNGDIQLDATLRLEIDAQGKATLKAVIPPAATLMVGQGLVLTDTRGVPLIDIDRGLIPMLGGANVFTGRILAAAAEKTAPIRAGATDPPTCDDAIHELFINTSSPAVKLCTAPNTWTVLATKRVYNRRLVWDAAAGGWLLPSGAANIVVRVNGLSYDDEDYRIEDNVLKANFSNMAPDHKVVIDFDQ